MNRRYLNVANLTNIDRNEMSDVITAEMVVDGKTLQVEFRPITKNVFQRKLLVVINGHNFDELEADDDTVNFYFEIHGIAFRTKSKSREAERAELVKLVMDEE